MPHAQKTSRTDSFDPGKKPRFRPRLPPGRTNNRGRKHHQQQAGYFVSRTEVNVRALRADDHDQWCALWRAYLAFYETTVPQTVYDSTFARLLGDDPQDFNGLVAETPDGLVGLTHYVFHRHGWKIENVCYLQDLYATPESRGKGVGRALIEAVYEMADAANAPYVYWMTQDDNIVARRLYDRIGVCTPFIKYQRR